MINVGIRKDIKKLVKDLEAMSQMSTGIYIDDVVQRLEEILRKNKKKKTQKRLRNEYIAVKSSGVDDDGDTFEAIKDGYGLPKTGYKYVKIKK